MAPTEPKRCRDGGAEGASKGETVSQAFTESIAPRRKAPNGVLLSPAKGRERALRAAVLIAHVAQWIGSVIPTHEWCGFESRRGHHRSLAQR